MLCPDQEVPADRIFVKASTMAIENADDRAEIDRCIEAVTGLERSGTNGIDRAGKALPDPLDLPPPPSIDRPRIILADDDADTCDYLRQLLSQSYQVEIAVDGVEAMAAIDRQMPDLVLTDVLMPKLDGLELLRSIRANPATQDLPVILLSGYAKEESRIAGLETGADDYIIKPFSPRELVARVDATLKLARIRLSARDRERALQQETDTAKANLDRIVANINNGFATFDRQWRYTYANNRLLEIFELPREKVLGKQAWEVFPHQVGIEFFDLLNRAMTERVEAQFEYYYAQVDCWVEHRVYPTDDGLAILMADVSERKRAELLSIEQTKLLELAAAELRESEIEYHTLFESIDEGFCMVEMRFDAQEQPVDYRFVQVNPSFFSLTGLPADAVGRTARELIPDLEDFWMETYGKVALTGAAVRFENHSAPMNRWFDVYAARVGDAASHRVAIVFTNITERKQAEKISQRAAKFDAFRIALADALRPLANPVEIQVTASRLLGDYLGANRVMYFEVRGTDYVIDRDYVNGVRSMCGSYPINSFGSTVLAALRNGQSLSAADVASAPNLFPEQRVAYATAQIGAYIVIPLLKSGDFVAGLTAHTSEPREWTPDELNLAEEVAERTWAAVERARAEVAMRESEAKYRSLFESIDEGYILIEMLFDATDRPIDFRYLDANPAAVQMLGGNPIGRQAREFFPSVEAHWIETLGRVAQTGIGERHELDASSLGAWYNFYAFSIDNADSRRVAVIFEDITVRKRDEANTAFLATIQDDFARLITADEIMQIVGEKLSRYLDTSQCLFTEIDEAQDRAIVEYNWHSADTLDLVGTYQLCEFVSAEFYRAARARETIVVGNTQTDARTNADRYAAFNVHAFVNVPFHRGNNWKYLLTINDVRSRDWREDEIELIYEVANRLFPRVERARAEAEVAANLRDTQLLRELGARLVSEDDSQTLYREILAAAIDLTGADAGTIQILDEQTQDLCLIASQGFESSMTDRFMRVDASSDTSCGIAIGSGTRTFVDFDAPHPDPHGSLRLHVEAGLLSAQSTPLISRTGKPIGMVSTHWRTRHRPSDRQLQFLDLLARQAADTIEQRQTTAALREREEQLRLATESSKLGMWFWNLETDTLTWTEQCKAIFGLPAAADMSYEIFIAALHPDDRQRTQAAVIRSMAEQADYDIEYRSCWPDGTIHWIAAKGSCTYNTTGTPIQMLGVAIDITERKRVEEALRASEAQLAAEVVDMQQLQQISSQLISEDNIDALYEQIVDAAIALMDADLGTVYTLDPDRNQLRLLASRGLHPAAVERWQSVSLDANTASGKAAATGEPTFISDLETCNLPFGSVDLDCARLSGIRAVQSTPLISRNGRIVGTICTHWRIPHQPTVRRLRLLDVLARQVADLLDRKQAEDSLAERARQLADLNSRLARSEIQLQERNQELNSFVHIVSHDLKAPLRAVANLSQWIEEDFEGAVSANTAAQMNLLRGRIYRMEGMIDGLLEYARVGRQDGQLELVVVAELVSEVIESIEPPPTFEIDIAAALPTFAANRLLLSQVFANLISNAFKHHDRSDGCIRISSRELGDSYEFAICDDGPGIAPEYRDRVFIIFQAANPQKNPDSTGIGLSIVKKIVETAGGKIWLESELGKGTTFYFTWPLRHLTD
ncbi:GAF domain-containing protein [Chamaesiphon sp. OTE_75_metabat_556]|uniref:GAF domain-containing protein n=1 Tax=Chamaesiphon sp. OTE_75_metabat_556 TaxID=2964692 RepID=UPI00286B6D0B|nr:GAF domain-containing protein [Chamaesiphon sp. OTE_75_metabat_556]